MAIAFLLERFRAHGAEPAVVFHDRAWSFAQLIEAIDAAAGDARRAGVGPGRVVSLEADFSPQSIALLLALVQHGAIVVPIAPSSEAARTGYLALAQVELRAVVDAGERVTFAAAGAAADHALIRRLRELGHPGLVLFTSGSSGEPKAVLHDWTRLLVKYERPRHRLVTLLLLLFDHIGGIDTLFQALSNAAAVVVPRERTPEAVCEAIERHRVQVLPASPSFLSLLLLSEAHRRHDLSSLRYVTYGAETMSEALLARLAHEFPDVTLLQKYGLTEVGTLRSHSSSNASVWVKVGGEGFRTRVVDGMLQIRAESSMVGYLNAPSPFTDDGWFQTGDAVEERGEYIRILGRASDLINVGGRKVYPAEVEDVIQELPEVADVAVAGERNPFTGQIVVARVVPRQPVDAEAFEQQVRRHCAQRLAPYKVPARVVIAEGALHTERSKKLRR
ncbi:MAG TPA: fatty acid--CoA ligase family protein [Candidatus Eisenbacteria bacterium]|nr:fatty acid--CoA ligase family protein [Candidatus Eisenbacteria bacterium]